MKPVFVILLMIVSGTLLARQNISRPLLPGDPFLVKKDTIRPLIANPDLSLQRMEGRFSHITSNGKVYIMSPDNMPCLVPDDKNLAPMPGTRRKLPIRPVMPNTLPVVPLIPNSKS